MAYTKQTWTNDVTAITAERMTHIEQGIYDNSLATDKINPSGTATTTAEIEEGQISDVIGFKSLKLKGQTSQYTTTGKNKLAIKQLTTQTINGVTFTPHYTGNKLDYVNVNGTATATAGYYLDNADVDQVSTYTNELPSGTYILSDFSGSTSPNAAIFFRYPTSSSTFTTIDSAENSRKLTMDSTFKYTSYIRINNGTTVNNMKFYPQLETGSTQTTYEPYTNGASPNPDFPQDVKNVSGYNVIIINSKNIANPNDTFAGYPAGLIGDTITYTASANTTTYKKACYIEANQQYTLSWKINTPKATGGREIKITDENGKLLYNISYSNTNNVRTKTFTSPYSGYAYIALDANATELQVEKGTSATTYIAHQGNNFEINLGKNLIEDETFIQGSYLDNTMTTRISCRNIKLKANTTYTISSTLNYSNFNISAVTSTKQFPIPNNTDMIYNSGWKNANFTFTTESDDVYINIALKKLPDGVTITPSDVEGIKFQIEKGANATSYAPYFTPIELCKIGTFQDYIFKRDGKWFKHKEIGKVVWNGTESWAANPGITTTYVISRPTDLAQANNNVFYNYFSTVADLSTATEGARIGSSINLKNPNTADLASFKTWLGTNNVEMYYQSNTPTDEEITYTPLIKQLDELYNSGLYDVTNISQDNSSEAFILDIEACKNNINGIVEYIRR